MRKTRVKNEDLKTVMREMEIGGAPVFDAVSNYEIYKIPQGFIFKSDYAGLVFVPALEDKKNVKKD